MVTLLSRQLGMCFLGATLLLSAACTSGEKQAAKTAGDFAKDAACAIARAQSSPDDQTVKDLCQIADAAWDVTKKVLLAHRKVMAETRPNADIICSGGKK